MLILKKSTIRPNPIYNQVYLLTSYLFRKPEKPGDRRVRRGGVRGEGRGHERCVLQHPATEIIHQVRRVFAFLLLNILRDFDCSDFFYDLSCFESFDHCFESTDLIIVPIEFLDCSIDFLVYSDGLFNHSDWLLIVLIVPIVYFIFPIQVAKIMENSHKKKSQEYYIIVFFRSALFSEVGDEDDMIQCPSAKPVILQHRTNSLLEVLF